MARAPERRDAQRVLAREVTRTLHGQEAVDRAEHASGLLFGERISELDVDDIIAVFDDVPSTGLPAAQFAEPGAAIADMLVATKLASSKGDAMRLVRGGGVYVNNRRVADERARFTAEQAICGPDVRAAQGLAPVPPGADRVEVAHRKLLSENRLGVAASCSARVPNPEPRSRAAGLDNPGHVALVSKVRRLAALLTGRPAAPDRRTVAQERPGGQPHSTSTAAGL